MVSIAIVRRLGPAAVGLAAGLVALSSAAEVQVKTLADGTRLIYNETTAQRTRRTANRLLPAPDPELEALIDHHARQQGLRPRLVQAVVQVESGYNPRALSRKGAMGLMQLMPATARELRVTDPWDPDQNVRGGTLYLRRMLQRYDGDLSLALAAYNAGPTAVDEHQGLPPYRETHDFVHRVLSIYHDVPPSLLRDQARLDAMRRRWAEARRKIEEDKGRGARVYVTRDENNRIIFTTSPPKPH